MVENLYADMISGFFLYGFKLYHIVGYLFPIFVMRNDFTFRLILC